MPSDVPALEDGEDGGVRLWHLVKVTDEPEAAKAWRSSLREPERERTRAKAIPEIYLTRLLSMKVGGPGSWGDGAAPPTEAGRGWPRLRGAHTLPPPPYRPRPAF